MILSDTGGVPYTDGGAADPPTLWLSLPILWFTTPTFARFSGFSSSKMAFFHLKGLTHLSIRFELR